MRIKLDIPDNFHFSTAIRVRIDDINYGGHLGNDALLGLIHEARLRYFDHLGFSEVDIGGAGIIMTDSAIIYKAEAFRGDVLMIEIAVDDITKCAWDFYYRVTNKRTNVEVARVKTGIVAFDYHNRKVVPIPSQFLTRISNMINK